MHLPKLRTSRSVLWALLWLGWPLLWPKNRPGLRVHLIRGTLLRGWLHLHSRYDLRRPTQLLLLYL
jgi:hypothetical protein